MRQGQVCFGHADRQMPKALRRQGDRSGANEKLTRRDRAFGRAGVDASIYLEHFISTRLKSISTSLPSSLVKKKKKKLLGEEGGGERENVLGEGSKYSKYSKSEYFILIYIANTTQGQCPIF